MAARIRTTGARIGYHDWHGGPSNVLVVNQGKIIADTAGMAITTLGQGFTNTTEGTLEASSGGQLSLSTGTFVPNAGTMAARVGSRILVQGGLAQAASGIMAVELGGTQPNQMGRIEATGAATLDGALNVTLVGGFLPAEGNKFQVIKSASRSGVFSTIDGLTLPNGLIFEAAYGATDLHSRQPNRAIPT